MIGRTGLSILALAGLVAGGCGSSGGDKSAAGDRTAAEKPSRGYEAACGNPPCPLELLGAKPRYQGGERGAGVTMQTSIEKGGRQRVLNLVVQRQGRPLCALVPGDPVSVGGDGSFNFDSQRSSTPNTNDGEVIGTIEIDPNPDAPQASRATIDVSGDCGSFEHLLLLQN